MFIDVHSHLNDEKLINDIPNILERAKQNGIEKIICVGYDLESSKKAIEIAEKYDNIYASIGIHPSDAENFNHETEKFLLENAKHKKVVAIGEIGLDYHYTPFNKELQKSVFIKQLEIANKVGLPVEIHTRDAIGDTIAILKKLKTLLTHSGIMHCFSESVEVLQDIKKLGLKISLGGVLTFKNAKKIVEVAENLLSNMLTFETDCPYLSPAPHRGETNEPKNILLTAQKFSEITNRTIKSVEEISTRNVLELFKKIK